MLTVPPVVIALQSPVIGNETESVILSFSIEQAVPKVLPQDLHWFYSPSTGTTCCEGLEEITNSTNRISLSRLTSDINGTEVSLTVSNIVLGGSGRLTPGETDSGTYFLLASNPAGSDFAAIRLIVFGNAMSIVCTV